MYRNITYSESDFYCRYLDIALNNPLSMDLCGGRFGDFLDKSFSIKKLPYNLKLIDLVLQGLITPDLFVQIPKEYFLKWTNYPDLGCVFDTELDENLKIARFYRTTIIPGDENDLIDFGHPYDSSLKREFSDRFSIQPPTELDKIEHPNGHFFYPYEAYFSYWKAYIIIESLDACKFIERYIVPEKGIEIFKNKITENNELWNSKYRSIFERLSHYRTFMNRFQMSDATLECNNGEISHHLLNLTNSSTSDLESDLEQLLELHNSWQRKQKKDGSNNFKFGLISLKRDIYFLFEWLCASGYEEKDLFTKWSYKNRQPSAWSQLRDVLNFEEISFSETFETYVPIYSQEISRWLSLIDITESYKRLQNFDSFEPWIRAFCDLHTAINNEENIRLVQPRVLDKLLLMTIRTEILLRSIYSSISGEEDPDLLKKVIGKMAAIVDDRRGKVVLETAFGGDNWQLTELRDRPEDIFNKIESCEIGRTWNSDQKYFFGCILKFVASRNYFAHHHYKDEELNNRMNPLCRKVLVACLHTVLYIDDLIEKGITG